MRFRRSSSRCSNRPGVAAPLFLLLALSASSWRSRRVAGRHPHLDRCEACAPLFGRELARAKALVPCVAALVATLLYRVAQLRARLADAPLTLLIALAAVVAATLTALSATMRAADTRAATYSLSLRHGGRGLRACDTRRARMLAEFAFCAIVAFFALRQYGETLARYDPV